MDGIANNKNRFGHNFVLTLDMTTKWTDYGDDDNRRSCLVTVLT